MVWTKPVATNMVKMSDSIYILEIHQRELTDELDIGCERRRKTKMTPTFVA